MLKYLKEIFYLLGPDRSRLPWMTLLFLSSSALDLIGLGLIVPYFYLVMGMPSSGTKSDTLLNQLGLHDVGQEQLLLIVGGLLIAVFLLKAILGMWVNRCVLKFSQNQQIRLRNALMRAYQSMPYTDYIRRNSVEYVHGIQVLTQHYANSVVMPMLRILGEGIVALVILAFLARSNFVALVLMVAIFGSVIGIYQWTFRSKLRRYGHKANESSKRLIKAINEGVEGLKEVRILGKEGYFHKLVDEGAKEYAQSYVRSQMITTAPRYLLEFLLIAFVVSLVLTTLGLGQSLQALAPVLALFGMAALRLLPMVNTFSNGLLMLRFHRNSVEKLYADLQGKQEHPAENDKSDTTQGKFLVPSDFQRLRLENVDFQYPGASTQALSKVTIEIRRGESIGLIGASGSGKTTLIDVLLGLLEPHHGIVLYNDSPISRQLVKWRRQIAYLPQQVFLTDDTLRGNVALGTADDEVDEERLQTAIVNARLEELVRQLPDGVNTLLGERGIRLSGGQRQRIALARAFYHGRDILVMDEATSALDNETEQEIVDEILKLKGQRTMIIIAHRLTTVMHCDRIYKLSNGAIIESGSPAEIFGNQITTSSASPRSCGTIGLNI